MVVLFTHEIHASLISNRYYNKNGVITNEALQNYLFLCSEGLLVTRCIKEKEQEVGKSYLELDMNGISVIPIDEFRITNLIRNYNTIRRNLGKADCYLIRLPGLTGLFVGYILYFNRKSFGVELAGDLEESLFEKYSNPSFVKKLAIKCFSSLNKFLIKKAVAVGYRSHALKAKYPAKSCSNEFVFSGAQINKIDIGEAKDVSHYFGEKFNILYLGRLSPEKGVDYLISAIAQLKESYPFIFLRIIGSGAEMDNLKNLTIKLGLENNIEFKGKISDKTIIHNVMDESQLYVIPSLTEGMPRALIEAMARGMVAIGSRAGGIPELLEEDFIFEPKSHTEIVKKIELILSRRKELNQISARNIELTKPHWTNSINIVKTKFWDKIIKS